MFCLHVNQLKHNRIIHLFVYFEPEKYSLLIVFHDQFSYILDDIFIGTICITLDLHLYPQLTS